MGRYICGDTIFFLQEFMDIERGDQPPKKETNEGIQISVDNEDE